MPDIRANLDCSKGQLARQHSCAGQLANIDCSKGRDLVLVECIAVKSRASAAVTAFDHVSSSQSRWIAADSRHATRIRVTDVDTIKQSMILTTF